MRSSCLPVMMSRSWSATALSAVADTGMAAGQRLRPWPARRLLASAGAAVVLLAARPWRYRPARLARTARRHPSPSAAAAARYPASGPPPAICCVGLLRHAGMACQYQHQPEGGRGQQTVESGTFHQGVSQRLSRGPRPPYFRAILTYSPAVVTLFPTSQSETARDCGYFAQVPKSPIWQVFPRLPQALAYCNGRQSGRFRSDFASFPPMTSL